MKKIIAILSMLALVVVVSGCTQPQDVGNGGETPDTGDKNVGTEQKTGETQTPEPTQEKIDEGTSQAVEDEIDKLLENVDTSDIENDILGSI